MVHNRTSEEGELLIKYSEGCELRSYLCGADKWSIGYGHTATALPDMVITLPEADRLFDGDLVSAERDVRRAFEGKKLSQGWFDACVSFVFNFGIKKFRTYTIYDMLLEDAPFDELADQWLKYQYTIRDDDQDGDFDAVIDNGLPIRRYRELLIACGASWQVAEAAADDDILNLKTTRVSWKGDGYKEVLVSRTTFSEVLERAQAMAAVLDEDRPTPKSVFAVAQTSERTDTVMGYADPTPDTPWDHDDLNNIQTWKLQGKPGNAPLSIYPPKVLEAPNVDLSEPPTPLEDSKTVRGISKAESGKEAIQTSVVLGGAAAAVPTVNAVTGYLESYSTSAIIGTALLFAALLAGVGLWRWWRGKIIAYEGRQEATRAKL